MRASKIKAYERALGQKDSPDALAVAWQECYKALLKIAIVITNNMQDAEDVLQDAYLRLQRANNYTPEKGAFVTWAGTTVRRTALDRRRRASTRYYAALPSDFEQRFSTDETAASTLITAEDVRKALEGLSDYHAELLELMFVRGYTSRQIATNRQMPRGTIKSQTFQAVQRFIANLQEILGEDAPLCVAARRRPSFQAST